MSTKSILRAIVFLLTLFFAECNDTTSELIAYRGTLIIQGNARIDTTISIYMGNLDYYLTTQYMAKMIPHHPDSNGNFKDTETTVSHTVGQSVEQWQCGPLRIFIRGDSIEDYHDSLTNTQLFALKQNTSGEWLLPLITLTKKVP
jgi:hypothetical protein